MPDGNDVRVQIAELKGRVDGVDRGLGRQEQACEARSQTHVQRELYVSERATDRGDIADNRAAVERLTHELATERKDRERADTAERKDRERAQAAAEERRVRDRRYWVAGVAIPTIALVIMLWGVLT